MPKKIGLMGKKLGMMRIFLPEGNAEPVTLIEAGPCVVLQKKTTAKEGYNAIQVGFASKKDARVNKPIMGHMAKAGKGCFYHVKEFRVDDPDQFVVGQEVRVEDLFRVGSLVDISAKSKGKGFQGVVRRHGFKGGRATHGSMFHRAPGSIGASAWPSRVVKGKKMPGHMGDRIVTKKNLTVMDLRPEDNLLVVKGSVPGAVKAVLYIY